MLDKIFFTTIILKTLLFSYEDLGTYGNTYKIKEESFLLQLNNAYNDLNKSLIMKGITKNYNKSFLVNNQINNCKKNATRIFTPKIVLTKDIINPITKEILYKKNTTINPLSFQKTFHNFYLMFLDADDKIQQELAREYLNALPNNKIKFIVLKGNLRNLDKKVQENSYIGFQSDIKNYNVQCIPSIYGQNKTSFIINEYNPKDITNEK